MYMSAQIHLVGEQVEDRGEGVHQAREGVGGPAHQTREGLAVESRKCMYDNYLCLCVCVVKTHTYMTGSTQMIKLQIKYDAFNRMDRQQLNDAISEKER